MESIGSRIRAARERKGLSFDQISRDTNIAKRYLQAIEEEDFDAFPGEPYFFGFLRNYCEYLGLPPEELIQVYRSMKIQEQPVPVEQLLRKDKRISPLAVIGIVVVVLALIGGGVYLALSSGNQGGLSPAEALRKKAEAVVDLADVAGGRNSFRGNFFATQQITVPAIAGNPKYALLVSDVVEGEGVHEVVFELNKTKIAVSVGSSKDLVFEQGVRPSIRATVYSVSAAEKLADVEFSFLGSYDGALASAGPSSLASDQQLAEKPDLANGIVLFEVPAPGYFTTVVTFKNYCFFRYIKDGKEKTEKFVKKASADQQLMERYEKAENKAILGVSNAAACKVVIEHAGMTKELPLGGPGEVVMKLIKWEQHDSGYRLVAYPLY
jgi:cytoskeleton protein RodZ